MGLGQEIKDARKKSGKVTQSKLAKELGITRTYMCLIEKDKRIPSLDLVYKIADTLNLKLIITFVR